MLLLCGFLHRKNRQRRKKIDIQEEPTNCEEQASTFFSAKSEYDDDDSTEEPDELLSVPSRSRSSMLSRRNTFYGIRERIPTRVDILRHPSTEWWCDARLDAPHIVEDLGNEPGLLGRTFKVRILNRDEKCENELEYFKDCDNIKPLRPTRRYLVVQLLMGERIMTSIAEVFDTETFDTVFPDNEDISSLNDRLKLIVNPANVRIPWCIYGPRESSTIAEFFGPSNSSIRRKQQNHIHFVTITIDVYSKFMIRSFLPKLAFQPGRVSDYLIVDYENRVIHTGFRLVCTSVLADLLKHGNGSKVH